MAGTPRKRAGERQKPYTPGELQPWQRPPFEPGNTAALQHGAYSPRVRGDRAQLVLAEVLEEHPHLAAPEFGQLLGQYARALAREQLAHEAIEAKGSRIEGVARLIEVTNGSGRQAKEFGDALGIGPKAAAELSELRAKAMLAIAVLGEHAPDLLEAIERALTKAGATQEMALSFRAALGAELAELDPSGV